MADVKLDIGCRPSDNQSSLALSCEMPAICIIGAGVSGICAAVKLKKELKSVSFTILEEQQEVGGTWLVNTYPGCGCDVESHLYSYSFEPNPFWSKHFSPQSEILEYLKHIAKKYDLYSHIQFGTWVKSLVWDEDNSKWKIVTVDRRSPNYRETEWEFDIVINGPGGLRVPNIPEQFRSFKGPMMHSAEWRSEINLEGKIVGLIGSGASAIQIIPNIGRVVKELHVFQRQAPYVVPRTQFTYYRWIQFLFYYIPCLMWLHRTLIYFFHESSHGVFKSTGFSNRIAGKLSNLYMMSKVKDPVTRNKLLPNYKIGCKRILVSSDYYPMFNLPNVMLNTNKIASVNEYSITTEDGTATPLDILILCTGFRLQDYFAPVKVIVRNNQDALEEWLREGPRSFYGVMCHNAPNHFILLGPNTGLGHNSATFMIECQADMIMRIIKEMIRRKARTVEVKLSAQDQCMNYMDEKFKTMVWGTESCGSWYANKDGKVTALYPGSSAHYWFKTRFSSFSNFDFK